ncbi:MAG: hypothetical protein RIF41_22345, partial [Polyangiaceae bacterium]
MKYVLALELMLWSLVICQGDARAFQCVSGVPETMRLTQDPGQPRHDAGSLLSRAGGEIVLQRARTNQPMAIFRLEHAPPPPPP